MSIQFIGVNGTPDSELKSCYDCFHCQGSVSLWCRDKEASKARGTSIPGTIDCPRWKPVLLKKDITWWQRFSNAYLTVDLSGNNRGR